MKHLRSDLKQASGPSETQARRLRSWRRTYPGRHWKPSHRAETVARRHLLLDRLRRVDRRRPLVLDHVARHQVAAVGGGVEHDVVGPAFDAALQDGLQRLVGGVLAVETTGRRRTPRSAATRCGSSIAARAGKGCPRGGSRSGRGPAAAHLAITWAWTAFTIELLPAPRMKPTAGHCWPAGPLAKRRVFSTSVSLLATSMPLSRSRFTSVHFWRPFRGGGRQRAPDIGFGRREVGAGRGGGKPVEGFDNA